MTFNTKQVEAIEELFNDHRKGVIHTGAAIVALSIILSDGKEPSKDFTKWASECATQYKERNKK